MFTSRALLAVVAGFGFAQMGCMVEGGEAEVGHIEGVGRTALTQEDDETNPTNTTRNGLETWKFHAQKSTLAMAFSEPLYGLGGPLNQHVQALMDSNNQYGNDVMKYAAKCMVPFGAYIGPAGMGYNGRGLLSMSNVWPTWGLDSLGANEGFACMAAHLNPFGVEVGLRLVGSPVQVPMDPSDPSDTYTFKEALWAAEMVSPSVINIHVWPLDDLYARCSIATDNALNTRVCGNLEAGQSCGLVVHSSLEDDCVESETVPGVYSTCLVNGTVRNVIQTMLDPQYVPDLYGSCAPDRER